MEWWKTAKPGDKVVCVDDREDSFSPPNALWDYIPGLDGLTKGTVYTVREISADPLDGMIVVSLLEIVRPIVEEEGYESGFAVQRFRPVQKKSTETGMAILKRILERPEIEIEEEA